jgi:hypothetical protein
MALSTGGGGVAWSTARSMAGDRGRRAAKAMIPYYASTSIRYASASAILPSKQKRARTSLKQRCGKRPAVPRHYKSKIYIPGHKAVMLATSELMEVFVQFCPQHI